MFGRLAISSVLGAIVTVVVLFIMQTLIATAKRDLDESGTRHFVDFVRAQREETIERKERKAEKPAEPEAPPDMPQQAAQNFEPTQTALNIAPPPVMADVDVGGINLEASDGEYLPIVKIAPVYPWKAQTERISGYCIVEYTVTTSGTVRDPVVVDANPPGVFDKASIEAALKFKYKPRVVNGEPIEVHGVRNLFNYRLED
ncbi:MAG: TonB family protein [bacterium]